MRLLRRLLAGIGALFHKRREEQELDEELRTYLDVAVERKVKTGMTREAALRAARVEMGSVEAVKEHVRDAGWETHVESVWQDIRHALRGLRRSPGFAAVAILTLALGIGANTAIFSVVNSLMLRALPVAAPEQLVMLSTRDTVRQDFPAGWSYGIWNQIRERRAMFGGAVAWTVFLERFDLAQGGEVQPVDGLFVSANLFEELGVQPLLGRTFTAEEDVLGGPRSLVAVISYGLWQRGFGGAVDVVGRTLTVERVPVTIVGVSPPEFLGPEVGRAFEIALPIGSAPVIHAEETWGNPEGRSYLAVMLRLKPEQSIAATAEMLRGTQREIVESAIPPHPIWGPSESLLNDPFVLVPASAGTSELRSQYSQSLVTIQVIAALVLLVACVNVANLLLARATAHRRELSTRLALGAPRRRVVQQVLVESLVLAAVGAGGGLLLAVWGSRALVAQLSTWLNRVVLDVPLDSRVLTFAMVVTVATAALFGTAPAIHASQVAPGAAVKDPAGHRIEARGVHARGGLIVAQVALSLVLLVTAGLFIRTFERLAVVPLGFESSRVLVVSVDAKRALVGTDDRPTLYQRLADAVAAIPGVAHAGISFNTPVDRGLVMIGPFSSPGGPRLPESQRLANMNFVTPGWFDTYGMAIRAGRTFDERDTAQGLAVVVVNEAFARKFLPAGAAIGSTVVQDSPIPGSPPLVKAVVGLVADSVDQSLRDGAFPAVYQPFAQWGTLTPQPSQISLSVQSRSGPPLLLARSVADTLTSIDSNLAFSFRPLADQVAGARHQERLVAWLSGIFGGLALLLAAIGLYGVTSYAVARRRAEIGIRMALGAKRRDVLHLALRQTILWTVAGVAAGLALAAAVTRYLEGMLFGVTPLDPFTFIAAPAMLVAVAGLAALIPARRAATVDPMVVLRCE